MNKNQQQQEQQKRIQEELYQKNVAEFNEKRNNFYQSLKGEKK